MLLRDIVERCGFYGYLWMKAANGVMVVVETKAPCKGVCACLIMVVLRYLLPI